VLKNCGKKTDKLSLWLQALVQRRGFNKTAVALANKNTRILWAMANNGKDYEALAA
jgi:transposase